MLRRFLNPLSRLQEEENDDLGGGGTTEEKTWYSDLGEGLSDNESIQKYKSVKDLAHAYVNASKMIGKDKMMVPDEKTSDEDWNTIFNKLGRPESLENYTVEKGEKSSLGDDFYKSFAEEAFKAGMLPKQANAIAKLIEDNSQAEMDAFAAKVRETAEANETTLREEFGDAYDRKLKAANFALSEYGGKEAEQRIEELGLTNEPALIKMFAAIGEAKSNDTFKGESEKAFGITPSEAEEKLNAMLSDPKHALHDRAHGNYATAMKEYNRLSAIAYAKK